MNLSTNLKLKKLSIISVLLGVSLFATACSAKEANAVETETAEVKEVVEQTVENSESAETVAVDTRAVDERYKALFASSVDAVKFSLENNPMNFVAETHYDTLNPRQVLIGDGEKIEVVEFFSYGCGHCFNAEPYMQAYKGQVADDVEFKRVPVSFNPYFELLARGYYAAEALGASEEADMALFDAIHIKRRNLQSPDALADFYAEYGIDKDEFIKTINSFGIGAKIKRDRQLNSAYKITGVPTVIVNGAYNTGGVKAGNYGTWFQILDQLTDSERKAKAAK